MMSQVQMKMMSITAVTVIIISMRTEIVYPPNARHVNLKMSQFTALVVNWLLEPVAMAYVGVVAMINIAQDTVIGFPNVVNVGTLMMSQVQMKMMSITAVTVIIISMRTEIVFQIHVELVTKR